MGNWLQRLFGVSNDTQRPATGTPVSTRPTGVSESDLLAQASALSDEGQYEEAIQSYRQVLSRNPQQIDALEGLGMNLGYP